MAEFQPFRLGEAISQGQQIAGNAFRLGEHTRAIDARSSLETAIQSGTPEAMAEHRKQYPVESMKFDATKATDNIQKMQEISLRADVMGRLAYGATDENTYQRALQQAKEAGIDVSGAPPNYDPNFIEQFKNQAMTVKQRVDVSIKNAEFELKRRTQAEAERHNRSMEGIGRLKAEKEGKGGDRSAPAHMNAVNKAVYDSLGLATNPMGQLLADVPPENLKKINANASKAQRIYLDNPGITPAEAAGRALKETEGSAKPLPTDQKQRVKGTVYETPKGPMTWSGTGWVPAP